MSKPVPEENQIVYGLTKKNLWVYIDLEREVQDIRFGDMTVTFRIHEGVVTDALKQKFKRVRRPDGWEQEAEVDDSPIK